MPQQNEKSCRLCRTPTENKSGLCGACENMDRIVTGTLNQTHWPERRLKPTG